MVDSLRTFLGLRPLIISPGRRCVGVFPFGQKKLRTPQFQLLEEFQALEGVKEEVMISNWTSCLPGIVAHLNTLSCEIAHDISAEQLTREVLSSLHLAMPNTNEKNKDQRQRQLLEIFPENTPVAETAPKNKEAPRLFAIGDLLEGVSIHTFVDTEPLFVTQDPIRALLLLLAVYYVFNIKFAPQTRQALVTLSYAVMQRPKEAQIIASNAKHLAVLRKMNFPL